MRRLVLKQERLSELTSAELAGVAGGNTNICPSNSCYPSWYQTCRLSQVLADCPSLGGC